MINREKLISALHCRAQDLSIDLPPCDGCDYQTMNYRGCDIRRICKDALALLKDQESLLGIRQTADDITFISTGTAQEGEERGIILGKKLMHEWLYKELLYNDLLTDEIRSVFEQAESI